MEQELKVKTEGYSETVLKGMILDKTEAIYKNLDIKEMKVVNIASGGDATKGTEQVEAPEDCIKKFVVQSMAVYDQFTNGKSSSKKKQKLKKPDIF